MLLSCCHIAIANSCFLLLIFDLDSDTGRFYRQWLRQNSHGAERRCKECMNLLFKLAFAINPKGVFVLCLYPTLSVRLYGGFDRPDVYQSKPAAEALVKPVKEPILAG